MINFYNNKYVALIALFIITSTIVHAQVEIDEEYLDGGAKVGVVEYRNIVKIPYVSIVRGEYSVYYESYIANFLGLQLGAGIIHQDYLIGIDFFLKQEEEEFLGLRNSVKSRLNSFGIGYAFHFSSKFYPQGNELEGLYLSPAFNMRNYKTNDINFIRTNATVDLGFQNFWGHFVGEIYVGAGIQIRTYSGELPKQLSPWITLGARIGWGGLKN